VGLPKPGWHELAGQHPKRRGIIDIPKINGIFGDIPDSIGHGPSRQVCLTFLRAKGLLRINYFQTILTVMRDTQATRRREKARRVSRVPEGGYR
jgi:hypothetical protein